MTHQVGEKTMLRLRGIPIARIVLNRIIEITKDVVICVLDRFLEDFKWEMRDLPFVKFNSSPKALGTLGHYMKAAEALGLKSEDTVLVYYGDTISSVCLDKMKHFFHSHNSECTIAVTTNLRHDYSAVDFDVNNLVTRMDEKPKMEFPSWTGIAIVSHGLIERYINQIDADKMDFAKGLFPALLKDMNGVSWCSVEKPRFHAYSDDNALYLDCGNINSYLKLMDMAAEGKLNV